MNAADLTFGIEFETTMPIGSTVVGGYRDGAAVDWLPEGWVAKYDGSIRSGRGRVGVEFVSPILQGAEGVRQVMIVLAALKQRGARVNQSTGLHIHVGGFDPTSENVERITTLVANFETAIYASTGTDTRERGQWCQSVQQTGSFTAATTFVTRYRVLNLTNLSNPGRPNTVEFRAFAGSLNTTKVVGYIRLCLGMVERALSTRKVKWTAKPTSPTSPVHRGGEGATQLTRLFYTLGWTRGRTPREWGDIAPSDASDTARIKTELMRLARQYDERKQNG